MIRNTAFSSFPKTLVFIVSLCSNFLWFLFPLHPPNSPLGSNQNAAIPYSNKMPELQENCYFLTLFNLHFSVMLKLYHAIYQQQDGFLKLLDLADCGFCQDRAFFLLLSRYTVS